MCEAYSPYSDEKSSLGLQHSEYGLRWNSTRDDFRYDFTSKMFTIEIVIENVT